MNIVEVVDALADVPLTADNMQPLTAEEERAMEDIQRGIATALYNLDVNG